MMRTKGMKWKKELRLDQKKARRYPPTFKN